MEKVTWTLNGFKDFYMKAKAGLPGLGNPAKAGLPGLDMAPVLEAVVPEMGGSRSRIHHHPPFPGEAH